MRMSRMFYMCATLLGLHPRSCATLAMSLPNVAGRAYTATLVMTVVPHTHMSSYGSYIKLTSMLSYDQKKQR